MAYMTSKPKILPIYPNIFLMWPYIPFKGALKVPIGSNGLYEVDV